MNKVNDKIRTIAYNVSCIVIKHNHKKINSKILTHSPIIAKTI